MDRDELLTASEKDFAVSTSTVAASNLTPMQEFPSMGIRHRSHTQPTPSTLDLLYGNDDAVKDDHTILNTLGPNNSLATCQHCRATVKTSVKYSSTSRTHIAAALWCFVCCCCCIPYCCDSAKNSDHYCPACSRYIGTYEK